MNDLNQKARRILHFRIHDSYHNFKKNKKTKQIPITDGLKITVHILCLILLNARIQQELQKKEENVRDQINFK